MAITIAPKMKSAKFYLTIRIRRRPWSRVAQPALMEMGRILLMRRVRAMANVIEISVSIIFVPQLVRAMPIVLPVLCAHKLTSASAKTILERLASVSNVADHIYLAIETLHAMQKIPPVKLQTVRRQNHANFLLLPMVVRAAFVAALLH